MALCRRYDISPKKERGQNFLVDREILDKIVAAADLQKNDTVLEIGPGFGVLTVELVERVQRVVAVEADRRLVAALGETMVDYKNVEIIQEDILKFPISELRFPDYEYKIVANLPYQITSAAEPGAENRFVTIRCKAAENSKTRSENAGLPAPHVGHGGPTLLRQRTPNRAGHGPRRQSMPRILNRCR